MKDLKDKDQRLYIEAIRKHIESKCRTAMRVVHSSDFANTKTCKNDFLMIIESTAAVNAVDFKDEEGLILFDKNCNSLSASLCHVILWDFEFTMDEKGKLYINKESAKNGVLVIDEECLNHDEVENIAAIQM